MTKKYEFIREIGNGGMSIVYLARDKKLSMRWSIKKIDLTAGEHIAESIKREAMALRMLRTDAVARLADLYREGNYICLCMEYVEGRNLREIIKNDPEYAAKNAAKWGEELAGTLSILHSLKMPLIYRDMKPGNVILRPNGRLCLIDFGAARLKKDAVSDTAPTGTRNYAPPEQFRGYADERSDIYALGKTIEKIAGNKASPALKRIIAKAVNEDPEKRYQTAREMKKALKRLNNIRKYRGYILAAAILPVILIFAVYINSVRADKESLTADGYRSQLIEEKEEYLRISVKNGNIEEALNKIDDFILEADEENISELCYESGLAAFFELEDYEKALNYFEKTDFEKIPEASYLRDISKNLSILSEDRPAIKEYLGNFRKFSLTKVIEEDKARNLLYIARTELIISPLFEENQKNEILKKACEDIELVEDIIKKNDKCKKLETETADIKFMIAENLNYDHIAIEAGIKWLESVDPSEDKEKALMRISEIENLLEKEGDEEKIINFYEKAEKLLPYEVGETYLKHMNLILEKGGELIKLKELLANAALCEDIKDTDEFVLTEKRVKEILSENEN